TTANSSFSQLIPQLNAALGSGVVDVNHNGVADPAELTTLSLSNELFFTTIAGGGGAASSKVYLFSTSPTGADWPTSVSLTANRTDPLVTALGFDDGGSGDTSTTTASASGVIASLVNNGANPLASVGVKMSIASLTGTLTYGFSSLEFSGAN